MSGWRAHALCAEVGGDLWFPEPNRRAVEAKRICGICPVRAACLADALETGDVGEGIRAGLAPRERQNLLRGTRPLDDRTDLVRSMKLAGTPDSEIADRLGVHSRTVARIWARVRDAA